MAQLNRVGSSRTGGDWIGKVSNHLRALMLSRRTDHVLTVKVVYHDEKNRITYLRANGRLFFHHNRQWHRQTYSFTTKALGPGRSLSRLPKHVNGFLHPNKSHPGNSLSQGRHEFAATLFGSHAHKTLRSILYLLKDDWKGEVEGVEFVEEITIKHHHQPPTLKQPRPKPPPPIENEGCVLPGMVKGGEVDGLGKPLIEPPWN